MIFFFKNVSLFSFSEIISIFFSISNFRCSKFFSPKIVIFFLVFNEFVSPDFLCISFMIFRSTYCLVSFSGLF